MSLELINAKDRIPNNVLSNGAIKYGVYDENENLLRYEYYKREDEPIEEGTNINKKLFDLIDSNFLEEEGNRCRVDRYNVPEYELAKIETLKPFDTRINPNMTSNSQDGWSVTGDGYSTSYPLYRAFDGDGGLYTYLNNKSSIDSYIKLAFPYKIKPSQISIITATKMIPNGFAVELSDDNENWINIGYLSNTSESEETETFVYDGEQYFKYLRINQEKYSGSYASSIRIDEIYINSGEYIDEYYYNKLTLKLKVDSYENNSIINVQIPEGIDITLDTYLAINNLEQKEILFKDSPNTGNKYILLYNGTSFEVLSSIIFDIELTEDVTQIDISNILEKNAIYSFSIWQTDYQYYPKINNIFSVVAMLIQTVNGQVYKYFDSNYKYTLTSLGTIDSLIISGTAYKGTTFEYLPAGTKIQIRRLD